MYRAVDLTDFSKPFNRLLKPFSDRKPLKPLNGLQVKNGLSQKQFETVFGKRFTSRKRFSARPLTVLEPLFKDLLTKIALLPVVNLDRLGIYVDMVKKFRPKTV